MDCKIENFEQLKQGSSNKSIMAGQDNNGINKQQSRLSDQKIQSQGTIYNYQQALQMIMSGENTQNHAYTKKNSKDGQQGNNSNSAAVFNFTQFVKNQQGQPQSSQQSQVIQQQQQQSYESPKSNNDNGQQQQNQQKQNPKLAWLKKGDTSNRNRSLSQVVFEYVPKEEQNAFGNNKMTINQNNQKVVFVNFKMKDFPKEKLNISINALMYGTKATLCIPNRKTSQKVLLVMSTTSADKLKAINISKLTEKVIDITKICDIEYGIKNENHANIRGLDSNRVISFLIHDKEELECLVQFETQQAREHFLQGFQHFVKLSHKTQLVSGNIFKLRQQIEMNIREEELDDGQDQQQQQQLYDINEILDIFDSKVQLSISRSYLKSLYVRIIKEDLDIQLASQKINYVHYQKILSDDSGLLKPITNKQFLCIIDMMLDRSELYSIFEKASVINDIKNINKSEDILNIEGFKSFILYHQKEIVPMSEIEKLFKKILTYEKINYQPIPNTPDINQQISVENQKNNDNNQNEEQQQLQQQQFLYQKKKDSISFHGFVRYIYSKNNSIMNPNKESIYQNMNKPINEYYINSAKNIFHANFDILTMTKIAGFNFGKNEKYFPLLYVLSRGARYIEIEVWDGDTEPVIIYGPIMNTKLNISEFLTQLTKQAFVINPYPLFLNIVPHCTVKQQFKLKYLIEKILKGSIYIMPQDYKERTNLPSPNELKYKFILTGKLPHSYDSIIQETYTQNDILKFQQQFSSNLPSKSDHQPSLLQQQPSQQINLNLNKSGIIPSEDKDENNNVINFNLQLQTQSQQQYLLPQMQNMNMQSNESQNNMTYISNNNQTILQNQSMNQQNNSLQVQNYNSHRKSQGQIQPLTSQQSQQIDGTLLTPVHVFSQNNLGGDSIDEEMNEMILQDDEFEENVNVFLANGYVAKQPHQLISQSNNHNSNNSVLNQQSIDYNNANSNTMINNSEYIQSTARRGQSSTVKAIDSFFSKNLEPPKFKRFIQYKYDDTNYLHPDLMPSGTAMDVINEESTDINNNAQNNNNNIIDAKRGTYLNLKYHPNEKFNNTNSNNNGQNIFLKSENGIIAGQNGMNPSSKNLVQIDEENLDSNQKLSSQMQLQSPQMSQQQSIQNILQNQISRQKKESLLNLNNTLGIAQPSNGIIQSQGQIINSGIFQMHCIRDYAPIHASNTIESLYSMYISKITKKKPALWEIYDFSQRELKNYEENRLTHSVLSSYANIESFTKYYLAMTKPSCKPSDSHNINPIPAFNQGFQFILNFFHTFDKNSLIYQSRFYENGGQTCGYILKPFHLRNHLPISQNKNKMKSMVSDNNFATQLYFNQKIDEQDELNLGVDDNNEDNEEMKLIQTQKTRRHFVQMQVISGFNLSTSYSDRVDAYVEVMVFDGDNYSTYKTNTIENNNMNPKWNYEFKFTVQNPQLCFIVFQAVNTHHTNLLGWYSIPFTSMRQGFRVVPLKDGFFNTIKNSFILCELSVVRENLAT